ncbi:hypothetical protein EMGBS15_08890 [Filimonas sp.]|nr:hypothetical protein EMGBS15_08890 [Filimonas sp.]
MDTVCRNQSDGKTGKTYEEGTYYLHEQSINLCREDLVEIYLSKGLIGIQLDEKRIMGPLAFNELKLRTEVGGSSEQKYVYAKAVWANIFVPWMRLQEVVHNTVRSTPGSVCDRQRL